MFRLIFLVIAIAQQHKKKNLGKCFKIKGWEIIKKSNIQVNEKRELIKNLQL